MTEKIYIRSGVNQKVYFRMIDFTLSVPGVDVYFEGEDDKEPFTPTVQEETAPISFRLAQNDPQYVYSPDIYYVKDRKQWCYEIDSTLLTEYGTGDIVIIDDRIKPVFIDFEVIHEHDYGATFAQVAALETAADMIGDITSALTLYGVPTGTSTIADMTNTLQTYGVSTKTDITSATSPLALQSTLNTVSSNVSAIKSSTDTLTLAAIRTQVDGGFTSYSPATSAQILSMMGSGWSNQTLTAIYALIPSLTQILNQTVTALTNYGTAKTTDITGAVNGLASAANLATANSNISLIKAKTDLLTLENINTQCDLAITDSGLSNSIALANTNISELEALITLINSATFAAAVWDYTDRTLTSSSGSGGAAIDEISDLIDSKGLATLAAMASYFATLNNVSVSQVYQQMLNAIANSGLLTSSYLTTAITPLAKEATLSTASSNISSIKTNTDQLTLTNIKSQTTQAINDASIPASLTQANANISTIENSLSQLTVSAIVTAVWNAVNRTLTSTGTGGGATISEISTLIDSKGFATLDAMVAEFATQNDISPTQVYTQVVNALTAQGLLTSTQMSTLLAGVATQSSLTTIGNNVSSIKLNTDLLTLPNIRAQAAGALTDNSIPGNISLINTNVLALLSDISSLTLENIKNTIWTAASRTLTSSSAGGGATAEEISDLLDEKGLATELSMDSNFVTSIALLNAIKGITDLLTISNISGGVWTNPFRTLTSTGTGGAATKQDVEDALSTLYIPTAEDLITAYDSEIVDGTITRAQFERLIFAIWCSEMVKDGSIREFKSVDGTKTRIKSINTSSGRIIDTLDGN